MSSHYMSNLMAHADDLRTERKEQPTLADRAREAYDSQVQTQETILRTRKEETARVLILELRRLAENMFATHIDEVTLGPTDREAMPMWVQGKVDGLTFRNNSQFGNTLDLIRKCATCGNREAIDTVDSLVGLGAILKQPPICFLCETGEDIDDGSAVPPSPEE